MAPNLHKRPWRKIVKKLQRKKRRQKLARERDKELEEVELTKLKDPLYKSWVEQQETIKRQQQLAEEKEHQKQEELWIQREIVAQKQFEKDRLKREAEEAKLQAERLKEEEELKMLEEARKKKREAIILQTERAAKEFENIMSCMQEYLDDQTITTPAKLKLIVESRPGEKSCDFFDKTNCCRFDPTCSFNHKRPLLANIILIKHFFQHPLLKQEEHVEYSHSDSDLELNERDLRDSYDEFCEDVWPVLEEFGKIKNFYTLRNVQAHLRGHVFVEYAEKRSALKAFINLQNRYYASKRLNVEFSNIQQWYKGVCGMRLFLKGLSLGRKCPKGVKCNFMHLIKNIGNKYYNPIDNPERSLRSLTKSDKPISDSPAISWSSEDIRTNKTAPSRNWRWSESPEIEHRIKHVEESLKVDKTPKNTSKIPRSNSTDLSIKSINCNLNHDQNSKKHRTKSPRHHEHKSKRKFTSKERKDLNSKTKTELKTLETQKGSSKDLQKRDRLRRSSSRNLHHHKSSKRSRSKSPSKSKKKRNH